jgi:hypothetical protein
MSTNNTETKYYIVSTEYVGPVDRNSDPSDEVYQIQTEPEHYNGGDRGVCTDGWAGTTNDVSVHAHGEHETLEEAEKALQAILDALPGGYRELEVDDYDEMQGVLAKYAVGDCEPYGYESTMNYINNGCAEWDIGPFTSDAEIEERVEEACSQARADQQIALDESACEDHFKFLREEAQEEIVESLEEISDREPEEYWNFNHTFGNEDVGFVSYDDDPREHVCDEVDAAFEALPEALQEEVIEFADAQKELAEDLISRAVRALKALDTNPELAKYQIRDMIRAERVVWPDGGWTEGLRKLLKD